MTLSLRIPPVGVTGIAALLVWSLARATPALTIEALNPGWAAIALGGIGVACSVLGVASFRQARTTVNPLRPGAASTLVASGIYKVTRNPMYLGFLLLLVSEVAWLANAAAVIVVPVFVLYLNRFQIVPEERALLQRFGGEYSNYTARVPRWL
jgi:protein-S-isoprenylcysteine O-methyltransferase Ste14